MRLHTLLDFLDEKNLIKRNFYSAAEFGDFVLFSGMLTIVDHLSVQKLYTLPAMRQKAIRIAMESKNFESEEDANIALDLLGTQESRPQALLVGSSQSVWCTLKPEFMMTTPSDILLKHGFALEGDWHIVGILDAKPNADDLALRLANRDALKTHYEGFALTQEVIDVLTTVHGWFGRPAGTYAVTPLLIFRKIGK